MLVEQQRESDLVNKLAELQAIVDMEEKREGEGRSMDEEQKRGEQASRKKV